MENYIIFCHFTGNLLNKIRNKTKKKNIIYRVIVGSATSRYSVHNLYSFSLLIHSILIMMSYMKRIHSLLLYIHYYKSWSRHYNEQNNCWIIKFRLLFKCSEFQSIWSKLFSWPKICVQCNPIMTKLNHKTLLKLIFSLANILNSNIFLCTIILDHLLFHLALRLQVMVWYR